MTKRDVAWLQESIDYTFEDESIRARAFIHSSADIELAISGGEDYELLFTANCHSTSIIKKISLDSLTPLNAIGVCTGDIGIKLVGKDRRIVKLDGQIGYQHFN